MAREEGIILTFRFAVNMRGRDAVWVSRQRSDALCASASQRITRLIRFCIVSLLALGVYGSGHVYAQNGSQQSNPVNTTAALNNQPKKEKDKKEKKPRKKLLPGSFVVAPLPIVSPAIGDGIIPVVGYIFP